MIKDRTNTQNFIVDPASSSVKDPFQGFKKKKKKKKKTDAIENTPIDEKPQNSSTPLIVNKRKSEAPTDTLLEETCTDCPQKKKKEEHGGTDLFNSLRRHNLKIPSPPSADDKTVSGKKKKKKKADTAEADLMLVEADTHVDSVPDLLKKKKKKKKKNSDVQETDLELAGNTSGIQQSAESQDVSEMPKKKKKKKKEKPDAAKNDSELDKQADDSLPSNLGDSSSEVPKKKKKKKHSDAPENMLVHAGNAADERSPDFVSSNRGDTASETHKKKKKKRKDHEQLEGDLVVVDTTSASDKQPNDPLPSNPDDGLEIPKKKKKKKKSDSQETASIEKVAELIPTPDDSAPEISKKKKKKKKSASPGVKAEQLTLLSTSNPDNSASEISIKTKKKKRKNSESLEPILVEKVAEHSNVDDSVSEKKKKERKSAGLLGEHRVDPIAVVPSPPSTWDEASSSGSVTKTKAKKTSVGIPIIDLSSEPTEKKKKKKKKEPKILVPPEANVVLIDDVLPNVSEEMNSVSDERDLEADGASQTNSDGISSNLVTAPPVEVSDVSSISSDSSDSEDEIDNTATTTNNNTNNNSNANNEEEENQSQDVEITSVRPKFNKTGRNLRPSFIDLTNISRSANIVAANAEKADEYEEKHPMLLEWKTSHSELHKEGVVFAEGRWTKKEVEILKTNIIDYAERHSIPDFKRFFHEVQDGVNQTVKIKDFYTELAVQILRPLGAIRKKMCGFIEGTMKVQCRGSGLCKIVNSWSSSSRYTEIIGSKSEGSSIERSFKSRTNTLTSSRRWLLEKISVRKRVSTTRDSPRRKTINYVKRSRNMVSLTTTPAC